MEACPLFRENEHVEQASILLLWLLGTFLVGCGVLEGDILTGVTLTKEN